MASNPYLAFAKAWGVNYDDVLSFRDAYKIKFDKNKMSFWHRQATNLFQGTDTADAIIAIYRSIEDGGSGDVVRCHHMYAFTSSNGLFIDKTPCRFGSLFNSYTYYDWEIVEARFLADETKSIPCRMALFIIGKDYIVYRVTPEDMKYAYMVRYADGKYEIKGDPFLFPEPYLVSDHNG